MREGANLVFSPQHELQDHRLSGKKRRQLASAGSAVMLRRRAARAHTD